MAKKCHCRECRFMRDKHCFNADLKRRTNERMRTLERAVRRDLDPILPERDRVSSSWDFA